LNYADQHVHDSRLPTYFVNELEDVEFTHPLYREIYYEFKAAELRDEPVNTNFFIQHGTTEIKRVVTDLTVSRYQVSKHWGDKYKIFIPTESDKLSELAYGNVLHLKLRVIQKHLDDNLKLLKEVKNIEEENSLLEFQKQLKSGEIEISNYLGIVIGR
jgi:DNA primase